MHVTKLHPPTSAPPISHLTIANLHPTIFELRVGTYISHSTFATNRVKNDYINKNSSIKHNKHLS